MLSSSARVAPSGGSGRRVSTRASISSDSGSFVSASGPSDDGVKVACRVRPFSQREISLHEHAIEGKPQWEQYPLRSVVEFRGQTCILYDNQEWQEKERFTFDGCLWSIPSTIQASDNEFVSQETLFDLYGRDLLNEVWKGYNTCFFAYGQTGSGKTYSMMGEEDCPGFIPRLGQCLFDQIEAAMLEGEEQSEQFVRQYRVEVRYMEIYNEMAKDLLWPLSTLSPDLKAKLNPENLKIRSTPMTGVFVEGLTAVEVDSWKRMHELIELGNVARSVASTKMNERSSRSHAIFKITLSQITTAVPKKQFEKPTQHLKVAQINLVDLAGSERNKKTGATGDRLKEAASINRSLMCLKQVIDALVDNAQISKSANKKRVPYRDSHLTSILADSLGGNSKTWMLVCVSPHDDNLDETQQTLRYGSRARKIVNSVHVNENAAARLMLDLEDELERLKAELANKTSEASSDDAVDDLKDQIAAHEQSIRNLEEKVEAQKESIAALEVARERNIQQRQTMALSSLSRVMQAKLRRDQAEQELELVVNEVAGLEETTRSLASSITTTESEITKCDTETLRLREAIRLLESQSEDFLKSIAKLETQRRTLQRSCDDSEQFVKSLASEKVGAILKARLQVARLHVEYRRKLADLECFQQKEVETMRQRSLAETRKRDEDLQSSLAAKHQQVAYLKSQISLVEAERERLQRDKTSQIVTLQQEVHQLQQDLRRKREQRACKTSQINQDWEKKISAMTAEFEKQQSWLEEEFKGKRELIERNSKDAQDAFLLQHKAAFDSEKQYWERQLEEASAQAREIISSLHQEWSRTIEEKKKRNEALRDELRQVQTENQKYCDLQYRIATNLELLQKMKVSRRVAPELSAAAKLALEFHALFEEFHPEKPKLEHLIRANVSLQRCSVAPVLGEGEEGSSIRARSPAARSQSPIVLRGGSSASGRQGSSSPAPGATRRSVEGSSPAVAIAAAATPVKVLRSVSPRIWLSK